MCGIVGYVGNKQRVKFLIETLSKLEYRGYDSAGFASLEKGKIKTIKKSGNIQNLIGEIKDDEMFETGIAHTRWATHGVANEINAHPHVSNGGEWAVVHNGIIENYNELKIKYGLRLKSETDTAVVSELLEIKNTKTIDEFINVFNEICGSFAIAAISKNKEKTMFLAKQKSPLYVSENMRHDFMVASDPICFLGFSNSYYTLDDGEFAKIENGSVKFFNDKKESVLKEVEKLEGVFEDTCKGDYSHFMIKEIMEEKNAILRLVDVYKSKQIMERFDDWFLAKFNEVKLIGCGTAYHAGLMGAKFIQKILGKKASAEMASEFIYSQPNFVSKKTLYIFVSQSGETADTLQALEVVRKAGATAIALTNVLYSSLAKKSDFVLPISAGVEIAVASTKAYVCMLAALYLFCEYFKSSNDYFLAFSKLENLAENILNFNIQKLDMFAEKIKSNSSAVFIGKDMDYVTALEASLKLKEVSYINANAYPSGELKHGFLALVEKGTPVFVFANQKEINLKTINSMHEAESRGGEGFVFTNNDCFEFKNQITISNDDEILSQIEIISAMQYLAYKVSTLKKINPDQPRNLAKSVTVE